EEIIAIGSEMEDEKCSTVMVFGIYRAQLRGNQCFGHLKISVMGLRPVRMMDRIELDLPFRQYPEAVKFEVAWCVGRHRVIAPTSGRIMARAARRSDPGARPRNSSGSITSISTRTKPS